MDTPETTVFRVMATALTAIVSQVQEDFRKMIFRVATAVAATRMTQTDNGCPGNGRFPGGGKPGGRFPGSWPGPRDPKDQPDQQALRGNGTQETHR
ncbi:MAG: hypothetical protein ACLR0U_14630 [Enterocloster clostridioformis]